MKKIQTIRLLSLLFLCAFVFQSCFKDTVSKTYTLYLPVYKTNEEVRANIKSSTPTDIKNPGKMFVYGNYIFLNEIDKGIHIIDNTNPSLPVNKYFINIPGNQEVAVTGNVLYADLYTDLVTIDISNPAAIQVKKITENAFPNRRYANGFVADTTKIITEWIKKDTTVTSDITGNLNNRGVIYYDAFFSGAPLGNASAAAPTLGVGGSMARFTLLNNYLYTVTENTLNVFNISQPENPAFSNKVNLNWGIETIYPFKNNLFLGSQTGMLIFSAANPLQPVQLGTFTHARVCDPVIADDDYAYVTLRTGSACGGFANELDVVNIQNLPATTLVKSYPLTNPHGLSKEGNTLFVCDGTAGLKVYDATNINSLQLLTTVSGINTYDVVAYNGVAIVVTKDGLYQYDYTNRSNLKLLSKILMN
jgi:hypothetical protein